MDRSETTFTRRAFIGTGLTLLGSPAWATEPEHDITYGQDFDELWETLRDRYCYFGEKSTDWNRVRTLYRPRALRAASNDAFSAILKSVLSELYDSHTNLIDAPDGTPRTPPFDMIVDRGACITALKDESAATDAGLAIGDTILAMEGAPISRAAAMAAQQCLARPDPVASLWTLNAVVSGGRGQPRRITVASPGAAPRDVTLLLRARTDRPDVEGQMLEGGIALITIRSFANEGSIALFDTALDGMRDARALIIDVRGNGGGDTAVARPIMGRFITTTRPYARMRRRQGRGLSAAWTETVEPREPFTYDRPVIILTDHWSASMAEGFPMGMRGLGRGTIVGTPMMGLGAAVFRLRLDRTGIEAQYSAEPVYDVAGRPRSALRPDVPVTDGADILAAGLIEARRQAAL